MHGLPLSVFGIQSAANYATAREDQVSFKNDTVKPLIKLISDTLNSDLVQGFDPNLKLIWKIQGLINTAKVATDLGPLFDRGIISVNELRAELGYEPIANDPIFDQHFILSTLVPIDLAGISAPTQTAAVETAARSIADRQVRLLVSNGTTTS